MSGIIHFQTFLIAAILVIITPGNDTIFILTKCMSHGKHAGILSVIGIASGTLIHTSLAAFGLSIIIAKSILLFTIIKYAGAIYLVYLGCKMLKEHATLNPENNLAAAPSNSLKIYRDAVLNNLLNPKVALFFIAFLPQFIDSDVHNKIIPFLLLGLSFTIMGFFWCLFLANFASLLSAKLKNNRNITYYINKSCGLVLIGLGIKVALSDTKHFK